MADLHDSINGNKGWKFKWESWEDDVVRKYYPENSWKLVAKYLPNRNRQGIQHRALKLGVKYNGLIYNKNYFNKIDSPAKAYWLGFIYADGYVTSQNRWGIELSIVDIGHLQKMLKELDSNLVLKTRIRDGFENCYFLINNSTMHKDLLKLGVIRNKTYYLRFPKKDILPEVYYSHFIRGFFDGDGCVYFSMRDTTYETKNGKKTTSTLNKEVGIVCRSEPFILRLIETLSHNNIDFHLHNDPRDGLSIMRTGKKQELLKFYDYIYKDSYEAIRLDRKYNHFNDLLCHLQQ